MVREALGFAALILPIVSHVHVHAQPQSDVVLVPFSSLPVCASSCGALLDVQNSCISLGTELAIKRCFCTDARLKPFNDGRDGVANICNAGNQSTQPKTVVSISRNQNDELVFGTQTLVPGSIITIRGNPMVTARNPTPIKAQASPMSQVEHMPLTIDRAGSILAGIYTLGKRVNIVANGQKIPFSPDNTLYPLPAAPAAASTSTALNIASQTSTHGGKVTFSGDVLSFPQVGTGIQILPRASITTAASTVVTSSCTAAEDLQAIESWYTNYCMEWRNIVETNTANGTGLSKSPKSDGSGLSAGAIAGVGVSVSVGVLVAIGVIAWYFLRFRKGASDRKSLIDFILNSFPRNSSAKKLNRENVRVDSAVSKEAELSGESKSAELDADSEPAELEGHEWHELA